ncbi:MAG: hypothetical protein WBK28_00875 [Minisyncoccia bacterium]
MEIRHQQQKEVAMLEAAELVRMLSLVENAVKNGVVKREDADACYEKCREERMTSLQTADELAKLIVPPASANDDGPQNGDLAA